MESRVELKGDQDLDGLVIRDRVQEAGNSASCAGAGESRRNFTERRPVLASVPPTMSNYLSVLLSVSRLLNDFPRLMTIHAFAATAAGAALEPFEYDPGDLLPDDVEIDVDYCGICHSDLSMINDDWGMAAYPMVPGHEVAGKISAVGASVTHLKVGQTVGLGWYRSSCMTCDQCMSGNHNLCGSAESTIAGRGGFADKVRASAEWAIPIPDGVDALSAGPLFCGGITVFNPIVEFGITPTDRVGVVGIGGLGHMALQFLNRWGCDVTAFSSNPAKTDEALSMGAHHVINSRDTDAVKKAAGSLDMVLVTANANLDWTAYLETLRPKGRLHLVGAVPDPVAAHIFQLLPRQLSVSATPLGSPATTAKMLEFCARHDIKPVTEVFPMSRVNEALEHLKSGKARYRIVLEGGK